jgi:dGTPase
MKSERARQWAGTMAGYESSGALRSAHADSAARIGDVPPTDRRAREAAENEDLAPGATRATGAGSRARREEPDRFRTCFERDRDRILHSTAFRRLAGKTQVFVFPDDHQRTRLTHALEVAQVARSIAQSLHLNVALTEAIALGHDCGHGPGGHASEDAFAPYLAGGFDHAVFGADVILAPLNLTVEVLDGIRNHSWSRPAPATPEGEVVSWADRIAYVCHDFEDAVDAGVVAADGLPSTVLATVGGRRSEQLGAYITGVVEASRAAGSIGMPAQLADSLAAFRQFNYERVYLRPESVAQADAVVAVLGALVEHLIAHPGLLPATTRDDSDRAAAAVAYVAGMTDRYAFELAVDGIGWPALRLPDGIGIPHARRRSRVAGDAASTPWPN